MNSKHQVATYSAHVPLIYLRLLSRPQQYLI